VCLVSGLGVVLNRWCGAAGVLVCALCAVLLSECRQKPETLIPQPTPQQHMLKALPACVLWVDPGRVAARPDSHNQSEATGVIYAA